MPRKKVTRSFPLPTSALQNVRAQIARIESMEEPSPTQIRQLKACQQILKLDRFSTIYLADDETIDTSFDNVKSYYKAHEDCRYNDLPETVFHAVIFETVPSEPQMVLA